MRCSRVLDSGSSIPLSQERIPMALTRRQMLVALAGACWLPDFLDSSPAVWGQTPSVEKKKLFALCIGVDVVDPTAYPRSSLARLSGAVHDAETYLKLIKERQVGKDIELRTRLLSDGKATASDIYTHLLGAAKLLRQGDLLIVSYAGHGQNIVDQNDDEPDGYDEAWCLFDGPLVDDELHFLWGCFQPGVRIVLLSDSCRSGSISRAIASRRALNRTLRTPHSNLTALRKKLGIETDAKLEEALPVRNDEFARRQRSRSAAARTRGEEIHAARKGVRSMPAEFVAESSRLSKPVIAARFAKVGIVAGDKIRATGGASVTDDIDAHIIQFGAAADNLDAEEINGHGVFTAHVEQCLRVNCALTYEQLYDQIQQDGLPQEPQMLHYGRSQSFLNQPVFLV